MPAPSARPRRLAAPALAAALALAAAACDLDVAENDGPRLQQQWVLAEEVPPAAGTQPAVDLNGGPLRVQLVGDFVRTCTAGNLQVTHALDGSTLTFRAVFTPADGCATVAPTRQYLRYFAYLFDVPAGTYQARVIHENDDLAGATGVVHEETVTVF